ncbi:tryptophan synthase subunit beta [Metabacillus litoralis]|uniref:tryptophan synthase subunit beta n=1 Tax=Metabacillus litoralis TaxID=152268 RepID=UPI001CFD8261|nr:tryptophan synthase subunit beta [Metabacillus litoralis]
MSMYPDEKGRYGDFGGRFVPETLMSPLAEIEKAHKEAMNDPLFMQEYHHLLKEYSGRPTTVTFAGNLTEKLGGAKIYLKREDLNHTGAHKINNAIGQVLLAKRMGKTKIIAETGAGQHGVATATVAAKFGMKCQVFMGEEDVRRQELNVFRMQLLGAEVIPVTSGNKTLKDATNEAMRYWVQHCEDHFYIIGSVVGPHPYPYIVREFQRVIGDEARAQFLQLEGSLPTKVMACVGGGSNAIGMFAAFLNDDVELVATEAAGKGVDTDMHAATITKGTRGVLHGSLTYLLQDEYGQITEPYSISAGLDYPGIGPEHAHLASTGRVKYESVTDKQALNALELLAKEEGLLAAIESAHSLSSAFDHAKSMKKSDSILICLSGRGDKDVHTLMSYYKEVENHDSTLQTTVTK